jgi:phage repressor protein C with HTH and peptisase S24 domain
MVPSMRPGALVMATGLYKTLRVGDVVIIRHDGLEKVKRLSQIDNDRIYVLGDNPSASTDSRQFGWLPIEVITAKVIWPRTQ